MIKIIIRLRINTFAISADIKKAFLHIALDENDRDVNRFLWLSDRSNQNSELTTYRFISVSFGTTCFPFILNATLLKNLDGYKNNVAAAMRRNLYVDNTLSSLKSGEDAVMYYKEARNLMSTAGFNSRSPTFNSTQLRELALSEKVLELLRRKS